MDPTGEHSIHEEELVTSTYDGKTKKVNEKDTNNNNDYDDNNDNYDGEEEEDDDNDGKKTPREVDNELLALVIQTNNKLKELGYNSLIINCNSDNIRLSKNTGAINIDLKNVGRDIIIHDDIIANIAQENDFSQERRERHISSNTTASKYANIGKLAVIKELNFNSIKMAELMFKLLSHIQKLPIPFPVVNFQHFSSYDHYREVL